MSDNILYLNNVISFDKYYRNRKSHPDINPEKLSLEIFFNMIEYLKGKGLEFTKFQSKSDLALIRELIQGTIERECNELPTELVQLLNKIKSDR